MNSIKVFSLLLAVSLASAFTLREKANYTLQQRIIGGETFIHNIPVYEVALVSTDGSNKLFCGGALISDQWVLTAASCIYGISKLKVQLGMITRFEPAAEFVVHKLNFFRYSYGKQPVYGNIALIKIPQVKYSKRINQVYLPQDFYHYTGTTAIASGWGPTVNGGSGSHSLQYVYLNITSNLVCSQHYPRQQINNGIICAQSAHEGICGSDIGGPLVSNNRIILIGIASFHHGDGCGTGHPDGFTQVDKFLEWIRATIFKYSHT